MWWVLAAVILALLAGTLASSLRVSIDYRRCGQDDRIAVTVSWLRILKLKLSVPSVKVQMFLPGREPALQVTLQNPRAGEQKRLVFPTVALVRRGLHLLTRYRKAVFYLIRRAQVHEFVWCTVIGTPDAAKTGFLSGLACSTKALLLAVATRYVHFSRPPSFKVQPDFRKPGTATKLRCSFDIRLVYVLLAGLKALRSPYR